PTPIRALIDGTLVPGFPAARDPLALAGGTLYLPTRRACRLARDLFLDVTQESAAILPRIVAIGDVDEDEIAFAEAATRALPAGPARAPRPSEARARPAHVGGAPSPRCARRGAARRQQSRLGARARRRSRAPDGRHDHARRGVEPARRARARNARPLLAAHARILADRARGLAANPRRAARHRACRAPPRADPGGS